MTIATICRISLLCIFWIASACQSERAPPRFPEPMRQASPDLTCRTCCPPPDPPPDPPPPPTCDPVACSDLDSGCVINRCSSGVCRAGTAPAGTVCQPATTGYNAAVCDGVKSTCPAPTCATGYKTCTATSSCIAQAACCPGGDCPLPFSDNFASGTAPEWTAVWGTGVSVAPNQLRLVNFTRVDAGMQSWSSYSVQASVIFPDATSTARIYGFTQGSNGYYRFEVGSDGHWAIQRATTAGVLSSLATGSVSITPNTTYYMKMVLESAIVAVEMSDDGGKTFLPLGSVSDATFSAGRIGLEGNGAQGAPVIFGQVSASGAPIGPTPVGASSSLTLCSGTNCPPPSSSPPGPINDGCHGDCECYAGGAFGVDGTQCGLLPVPDNFAMHFPLVRDQEEITGMVNAGGCDQQNTACADGTCAQPSIAGTDDKDVHDDRDFEFHVTPNNRNALTLANLFGNRTYGMADIGVEWEWMYMYPLWNSRFVSENGWPLTPTAFRGLTPGDRIPAGIPYRGDPIKVRGRLILDCGHIGANNEARSEIHPTDGDRLDPQEGERDPERNGLDAIQLRGLEARTRLCLRATVHGDASGPRHAQRSASLRRASDFRLGDRREVTDLSRGYLQQRDDRRIPRPQLRSPMGPHRPAGAMPRLATAKWRSVPDSETGWLGGALERNGGLQDLRLLQHYDIRQLGRGCRDPDRDAVADPCRDVVRPSIRRRGALPGMLSAVRREPAPDELMPGAARR